jgi:ubiquinone/menaquinone biosynthesis C-methylase UbiE
MTEKRDFDAAAATWDENPGRVTMAHDVAGAIRKAVPLRPDMDVLDFGCGTGLLTLQLQPLVRHITGVDSSQGMLDILTAKCKAQDVKNVTTHPADLDHGDVLDGQYDLVVSSMTFHHIRNVRPVLGQFFRVIRPSGQIAIADLDCDEGKFHDSNEGVFHFGFDRCVMQKHLESAGFVSIRNRTAATIVKPAPGGGRRAFTVFLMTGQRPVTPPMPASSRRVETSTIQ